MKIYEDITLSQCEVKKILLLFNDYFLPTLKDRLDISNYALKLSNNSKFIIIKKGSSIIGFAAYYNNKRSEYGYLSLIAVDRDSQKRGLASKMILSMLYDCKKSNKRGVQLEVHQKYPSLIKFYKQHNFFEESLFIDNFNNEKLIMCHCFKNRTIGHFDFTPTSVFYAKNISKKLGVDIYFKRDDLFESGGGGNKARKLQYILYKLQKDNYNAIVTAGDINSNHNRATAILGAALGVKVTLVVHNENPQLEYMSANMKLARLCNANVVYCCKKDVSIVMDRAMEMYKKEGLKPYYIWGGGHSLEGSYAFYDAIYELKGQIKINPDYIYLASGTGTTHAGIHVGAKNIFDKTKVVGISIARDKERGSLEIYKSIIELEEFLKFENSKKTKLSEINFDDTYISKGYESSNEEIEQVIKDVANMDGVLLDPTYTGKAFWGLCDHIKRGLISKGSHVVFWHTGGLLNLISK